MTSPSEAPTADQRGLGAYAAQQGTWTLTAPDGRQWTGQSPLNVVSIERNERVPASVQVARIRHEADKWVEGIIELKRDGDYLVVSIERGGKYVEVIRTFEPDKVPLCHAVHPSGIDAALEKAGLL
jgi:hypothetical protein